MPVHVTACPLDCPDTCSLSVTVEAGRITKVDAAEGNPLTAGYICQKVKHHAKRVYAPERILTPMLRTGRKGDGAFRPASWDEALDLAAERISSAVRSAGPNAVVPYLYNSSAGVLAAGALTRLLFARLGAPYVEETICAATTSASWRQVFDGMLSADPLDLPHARLIVIWGANPTVSNTHLLPLLTEAKRNGAILVVVDPRRTGVAARADLHLAVRPGTDVALAYAAARELAELGLVDREFCAEHVEGIDDYLAAADEWPLARAEQVCGVPAADIARFAELVGTVRPAMLRRGWGLERNRNGGSGCLGTLALWALAGQFGQRGAGVVVSMSRAAPVAFSPLVRHGSLPERLTLNQNLVGAALCGEHPDWSDPARVLFVQGSNPAATAVDQTTMLRGLARDDLFTIVHDQVLTDTAMLADLVLPAPTHFEVDDLANSYGSYTLQPIVPVIERVGESRSNDEVAAGLAARLGLDGEEFDSDPRRLIERMVTDGDGAGPRVLREPGSTVQFVDTKPRRGKARLFDPTSELSLPRYVPPDERYPLVVVSPATHKTITSMFAEFDPPDPVLSLHPDDAAARGLVDGQLIRVFDDRVSFELPCRVDPALRPGVCSMPKGLWRRHVAGGLTVNAFAPGTVNDLAGGACFNDARVDVLAA
jgi:anaerobic selenocysteine-containing dehydrogenase